MPADIIQTSSEEHTVAVGERLGRDLTAGDVVLLTGSLGAGKTAFVRGMARGLGASSEDVTSPTFTLIQEYRGGRVTLQHVDLYRLEPAEVADLGLDELIEGHNVVAIEWPERWNALPKQAIEVQIDDQGGDRRSIRIAMPR